MTDEFWNKIYGIEVNKIKRAINASQTKKANEITDWNAYEPRGTERMKDKVVIERDNRNRIREGSSVSPSEFDNQRTNIDMQADSGGGAVA